MKTLCLAPHSVCEPGVMENLEVDFLAFRIVGSTGSEMSLSLRTWAWTFKLLKPATMKTRMLKSKLIFGICCMFHPLPPPLSVTVGGGSYSCTCCHFIIHRVLWMSKLHIPSSTMADAPAVSMGCKGAGEHSHSPLTFPLVFKQKTHTEVQAESQRTYLQEPLLHPWPTNHSFNAFQAPARKK